MRGDSLENIRAGASGTVGIRKLLEQATAQRIKDALFVSLRVSLCVQICLPLQTLSPFSEKIHPADLTQIPSAFPPLAIARYSDEFSPIRIETSSLLSAHSRPTTMKSLSMNSQIVAPARPFLSSHPCDQRFL